MQDIKTERNKEINKILKIMKEIQTEKPHMGLNELTMAASLEAAERKIEVPT